MPLIAVIDVGTNGMRLTIANVSKQRSYRIVHSAREPVRLGHDVFSKGVISASTTLRAVAGFRRFREQIDQYSVHSLKATGTSALREARNRDEFLARVRDASGIEIAVIGSEEEARLVHVAAKQRINLKDKLALLVDIGGGSVEISVADDKRIVTTESYAIGSVRLLQILQEQKIGEKHFNRLVRQYVDATHRRLRKEIGRLKIQMCIGTGGSIESLGDLRRAMYGKNSVPKISLEELRSVVSLLHSLSYEERIQRLKLRPDRADVIVPAGIVLQSILEESGIKEVCVPGVGLKDGLLLETIDELYSGDRDALRHQVLQSALQLGRRYSFDEPHAQTVSRFALSANFDQLKRHHQLNEECRWLLHIAALLHDIGQFVSLSNHQRHTFYLLQASPVIGLTRRQMALVAYVARYHRKTTPKVGQKGFDGLTPKEQNIVITLTAILRLADALDHEHVSKIDALQIRFRKPAFIMKLSGKGDMLLEKWAIAGKRGLFEEVFGGELVVKEARAAD